MSPYVKTYLLPIQLPVLYLPLATVLVIFSCLSFPACQWRFKGPHPIMDGGSLWKPVTHTYVHACSWDPCVHASSGSGARLSYLSDHKDGSVTTKGRRPLTEVGGGCRILHGSTDLVRPGLGPAGPGGASRGPGRLLRRRTPHSRCAMRHRRRDASTLQQGQPPGRVLRRRCGQCDTAWRSPTRNEGGAVEETQAPRASARQPVRSAPNSTPPRHELEDDSGRRPSRARDFPAAEQRRRVAPMLGARFRLARRVFPRCTVTCLVNHRNLPSAEARIAGAWAGGGNRTAEPLVSRLFAALARNQVVVSGFLWFCMWGGLSSIACDSIGGSHCPIAALFM